MWKVMWKDLTTGWTETLVLWALILVIAAVLGAVILGVEYLTGIDGDYFVLAFLGAVLAASWAGSAKSRADREKRKESRDA